MKERVFLSNNQDGITENYWMMHFLNVTDVLTNRANCSGSTFNLTLFWRVVRDLRALFPLPLCAWHGFGVSASGTNLDKQNIFPKVVSFMVTTNISWEKCYRCNEFKQLQPERWSAHSAWHHSLSFHPHFHSCAIDRCHYFLAGASFLSLLFHSLQISTKTNK